MSGARDAHAGPNSSLRQQNSDAATGGTEASLVKDALRQLPSLDRYTNTPQMPAEGSHLSGKAAATFSSATLSPPSHSLSQRDTSYTLGVDDEELLLQQLVSITTASTPFVPSNTAPVAEERASTVSAAPPSTEPESMSTMQLIRAPPLTPSASASESRLKKSTRVQESSSITSPHAVSSSDVNSSNVASVASRTTVASPPAQTATEKKALTSKEEQDILDAILAAVDGQQSSVSGDLTGSSGGLAAAASPQRGAPEKQQRAEAEEEQDAVDRVLEEARLLATSTVLCATQRGELVLHIHEHVALRRQLAELNKTIGMPTCVALAEPPPLIPFSPNGRTRSAQSPAPASTTPRILTVAVGTNLGAVALFDQRWGVLGLCGSVEANVVNARGAVVSLSLCTTAATAALTRESAEEPTAATGHAKGVFILWSLHSLSPLRVITDESTVPLLRVLHLHRDSTRLLVLESSGAVKLFQFWKVVSKHVLRSTTVTAASTATPISDMDTLPFPSAFYLRNLPTIKAHLPGEASAWNTESGIPWLSAPPLLLSASAAAAGVSRTAWSTVADRHLVATVSNDAVVVYVVEAGLQGSVSGVARHTHPPSSALSNELIRFMVMEQEVTAPRVLICVSWNTEVELLLVSLELPVAANAFSPATAGGLRGGAGDALVQGVERLALLHLTAPLLQMVPLAGCSMLLLDQSNDALLMDASVAVMVERHHFASLEYVSFASRLCGVKYNGTAASNQTSALLLGKDRAYGISVYSWRERLATLVARCKFAEALDLAKGFAEEVALSMVGLSSNAAHRRRELHQYMERILLAYLESSLSSSSSSSPSCSSSSTSAASLLDVLQHVASYCSTVDGLDLLYGPITRTLQQRGLLSHLLCVLERTMRHGVVTYMPEPLIERFVDLFLHEDELAAVEVTLGVRQQTSASSITGNGRASSPTRPSNSVASDRLGSMDNLSGRDRAELALMCLDTGLPNLLRLAQAHNLVRLAVNVMSFRQKRYVEALAYALDEEDAYDNADTPAAAGAPSVAVDLVEYTLKDCALLPGADIPASEQRPAKTALLEFLLESDAQGRPHLLRFLRRRPQHAIRVLLFALSDEGLCSPWSSSRTAGLCRTQFVSSVFFLLTGGTRTRPRQEKTETADAVGGRRDRTPVNLFFLDEAEVSRLSTVRMLRAAELSQRSFPPYAAVHTFLSNAALFNELFLSDGEESDVPGRAGRSGSPSSSPVARLDVWVDLVIQDGLYTFQNAETAEDRRAVQEQLINVMAPPFIPTERVALFQPDFSRLRMARCLAALLCKEQRYTEAIRCYIDPVQNRIDVGLQYDVVAMLRGEMQRLQDLKTHTANAAEQLSGGRRFDSDVFPEADKGGGNALASPPPQSSEAGGTATSRLSRGSELSRHTSSSSFASPTSSSAFPSAGATEEAIKALQRAVMGQVEALVRIDTTALAQFVFDYLPSNHREVMRLLRGSSTAFLDYLDELMAQGDPMVANDINLQNTYIELLCAHAPDRVFAHLRDKGSTITYDVQLALRAVRKYRIADALIYLLEKTMMIEEAMTVMVGATRAALAEVREEVMTRVAAADGDDGDSLEETKRSGAKASLATASSTTSAGNSASTAAALGTLAKSKTRVASVGASVNFLSGENAVQAAPELVRLMGVGKELCRKYQADRLALNGARGGSGNGGAAGGPVGMAGTTSTVPSQSPEYWFRLLDIFMVPRRLLCEIITQDEQLQSINGGDDQRDEAEAIVDGTGMQSELELAARCAAEGLTSPRTRRDGRHAASPTMESSAHCLPRLTHPLTSSQRSVISALVTVYTQCTSDVLRAMMISLDLSVVMDKVVQDNKEEAFRPFKPIILDMMASLSFDLEANRLCASATESDVMSLGRELYQKLNTGIVTMSDCCALCHLHLSEPPPPTAVVEASISVASASPPSSAVCVYTCGHAYHTLCCLHAVGPSPQGGCYVCAHQRFPAGQSGGDAATISSRRGSVGGSAPGSAGQQAAAAPTTATSVVGARSGRELAAVDVARMQRRIRQTKVKIDHTEDLYPLLKSYLSWGDSAPSTPANATGETTATHPAASVSAAATLEGGNWVLAPSPRVPVSVGELSASPAQSAPTVSAGEKGLDVETLTDAEILELFGNL